MLLLDMLYTSRNIQTLFTGIKDGYKNNFHSFFRDYNLYLKIVST